MVWKQRGDPVRKVQETEALREAKCRGRGSVCVHTNINAHGTRTTQKSS